MNMSPNPVSRQKTLRMRDIAEIAGVHVTAVSAVLSPRASNRTRVSKDTAKKIQEIASRFNYRPHFHAQVMRKRKTGLIALLEFGRSEISSIRTIEAAHVVRKNGYQALTTNVLWHDETGEGIGIREAIDYVVSARAEGVLLIMPTAGLSPEYVEEIQKAGIPCVAFDGIRIPGVPQVRVDVGAAAQALTRHLIDLGREKLAFLSAWSTIEKDASTCWPILERLEGFQSAIQKTGGRVVDHIESLKNLGTSPGLAGISLIEEAQARHWLYRDDSDAGYRAVNRLFEAGIRPDALFCSNDHYAMGALRACFEKQIPVPEKIAVVGFAGEGYARYTCPSLTTVDTVAMDACEKALELLFHMIDEKRPIKDDSLLKVPCQLLIRESCGSSVAKHLTQATSS